MLFVEVHFLKYIVYFAVIVHKGADLEIMQQFCVMMAEAKFTEVAHRSMYFKFQVAMGGWQKYIGFTECHCVVMS